MLIRHGLPIRRELIEGVADPELSAEGWEQARHLGAYLASEPLDAVYSSPMQRARQTAEPVVAERSFDLVLEPDVAEFDRDSPEYVPVEELKAANDPRWKAMLDGTWQNESEDPTLFNERTIGAIERIIGNHRGDRVAITCHGGVINAYLSHLLGLDVDSRGFFYPNYTSIHRIAAASTGERSIVTINETSHLRGTGLPMGLFQKG
ncbi:histidine phosphatase family protein [Ilumatobacter sp.]|uniref:histidine phosphatase family protein n=1 Tax=Ilumatobacter sp. TaxID=1967498 RepID=UPI003C465DB4